MKKRTRRNHGAAFKAQVAVAALKDDKTLTELAERFTIEPPLYPVLVSEIQEIKDQMDNMALPVAKPVSRGFTISRPLSIFLKEAGIFPAAC